MRLVRTRVALVATLGFIAVALGLGPTGSAQTSEVLIYSARHYGQEPAFEAFTKKTGIQIKTLSGSTGEMFERLKAEGERTPADILLTVDAGNLWNAARAGLLSKVDSPELTANIPANLRDPESRWVGLTVRARTIMYNTTKVKPAELSTYEALGDPKWKGRLCLRTSGYIYNQSLLATMIKRNGEPKTEEVVRAWAANQPILINGDTKILEAIGAGQCDVGVTNHYYLARILAKDAAFPVLPFWANQQTTGTHVNVSGAGVTAAREEPRQRDQAPGVPVEPRGAADVRGRGLRVSGQPAGVGESHRGQVGQVQAGRHQRGLRRRVPGGRDAARRSRRVQIGASTR